MKKTLSRLLLLLSVFVLASGVSLSALAEEEVSLNDLDLEDVETVTLESPLLSQPLPVDLTGGAAPQADGYIGENVYEDPTIRVEITYKDISHLQPYKGRDAGAWIVDIRIGDATQLRTGAAESFESDATDPPETIAEKLNAVVAFNADFITRQKEGFILKQGVLYKDKLRGKQDRGLSPGSSAEKRRNLRYGGRKKSSQRLLFRSGAGGKRGGLHRLEGFRLSEAQ